jgi:phage-related protein (TIGR01555 family)
MPKKKTVSVGDDLENALGPNLGLGQGIGPGNYPMSGVFDASFGGQNTAALSTQYEFFTNTSYTLISLQRVLLSYAYVLFGPLRTLVDQPVYDAFRGGIKIKTDKVDPEEIEALHKEIKRLFILKKVKTAMRWDRLFGGAGIIINCEQDFTKPFNIDLINEKSKLQFITADRWELMWQGTPHSPDATFAYYPGFGYSTPSGVTDAMLEDESYRFNISKINQSRVCKIMGDEAPSLVRMRLQGWNMSVIECVIREMNNYFKENNVVFELLDEAKVDVWKINKFNSNILNSIARNQTVSRIQIAQTMKNFLNAVVLDKEDDYEQKQVSFAGLPEILEQIRIGMASAIRMPMSKIFGLASSGFSSGEDDLEVYNAIVEDQRDKAEEILEKIIPIVMMKVWGFIPDNWSMEWAPLRVLKATEEEEVKTSKFARASALYTQGIVNPKEYCQLLKSEGLLEMETEVSKGAEPEPPISAMMEEEGQASFGQDGAKAKKEKAKEG